MTVDDNSTLPTEIRFAGDGLHTADRFRFAVIDGVVTLQQFNGTDWVAAALRCTGVTISAPSSSIVASGGTTTVMNIDPVTHVLSFSVTDLNGVTVDAIDLIMAELPAAAVIASSAIIEFQDPAQTASYRLITIDTPLSAKGMYLQYFDPNSSKWIEAGIDVSVDSINNPLYKGAAPWSREWSVGANHYRVVGTQDAKVRFQYYVSATGLWETVANYVV
jgi:hypothetical protein